MIAGLALIVSGLALVWLAWVGSQRKLKPNFWVGIRTRATRSSDAAWYSAHETAAGPLGLSGGIAALLGVGVLTSGFDTFGMVATVLAVSILVIGLTVATIGGVRAADKVRSASD